MKRGKEERRGRGKEETREREKIVSDHDIVTLNYDISTTSHISTSHMETPH